MRPSRFFWLFVVIALGSGASIYFSSQKLKVTNRNPTDKVVVIDAPTPEPTATTNPPSDGRLVTTGPEAVSGCTLQPEFKKLKNDLGLLVNRQDGNVTDFLQKINQFKKDNGLPIPMLVSNDKLEKQNVVYNNCRSSCGGHVQEVFVSQILDHKYIQAFTKNGNFQNLALGHGGVQLAMVDELNPQGIPFRSWPMPASDSDWYVIGTDLYYRLDIPTLWLKVKIDSTWEVTLRPPVAGHLELVQDPLSIKGCSLEEKYFQSGTRHFKAPELCVKN